MQGYETNYHIVDKYEVIFAFFAFALFFAALFYCHYINEQIKNKSKNTLQKYYPSPSSVGYTKPIVSLIQQNQQGNDRSYHDKDSEQSSQHATISKQESRGSLFFSKIQDKNRTFKKFSNLAYNYEQNQHEMNVYRSKLEIKREREDFISRNKVVPQSKAPATKITPPKQTAVSETPSPNITPISKVIQNQNNSNILNSISKEPKKTLHKTPSFSNLKDAGKNTNAMSEENYNISDGITSNMKTSVQPKLNLFGPSNPAFKTNPTQPNEINLKPTEIGTIKANIFIKPAQTNPILFPNQSQTGQSINTGSNQITTTPSSTGISFPLLNSTKPTVQTFPTNPTTISPTPAVQLQKQKELISVPTTAKKITSSFQYLDSIINYSKIFSLKTDIKTIISNLGGAKSDPRQLWEFASSYIKTINPNDHQQAVTFSFRVWQAIVHKFIKNTNLKDGFEKMPPKQKSKQVEKNSINTYIILMNIFRMMGHQTIWLGVYGNTLRMLEFLFKRKQIIKGWKQLDLVECKYIGLQGDLSAKYHSRIDFLTYFLLGLTTFDPILVFEQISAKTGQVYPFLGDLKKMKFKWSYTQFWCMVESMRNNKLQAHFKIPFWNNTLTVIYPQMLRYQQTQQMNSSQEPVMKQFMALSKWIFKEVKDLTKKLEVSPQGRALGEIQDEGREGKNSYQFDGEEFIGGIKTLGRAIDTREREMRTTKWQQFRDKCSIYYYLWRQDSS